MRLNRQGTGKINAPGTIAHMDTGIMVVAEAQTIVAADETDSP
jgi:hypothetical protein